jgi:hypothetical protein
MNVNEMTVAQMTVAQVKELRNLLGGCASASRPKEKLPFGVGDKVLIRTVTMYQLGTVKAIGRDFITLDDGGWAADCGKFSDCLAKGSLNEFERAPSWFLVGRGAIVDIYPWAHGVPKATK